MPLTYPKFNPYEHLVKPTYSVDELLLLIGDDDTLIIGLKILQNMYMRCNQMDGYRYKTNKED